MTFSPGLALRTCKSESGMVGIRIVGHSICQQSYQQTCWTQAAAKRRGWTPTSAQLADFR
jgi:hypothetical protein